MEFHGYIFANRYNTIQLLICRPKNDFFPPNIKAPPKSMKPSLWGSRNFDPNKAGGLYILGRGFMHPRSREAMLLQVCTHHLNWKYKKYSGFFGRRKCPHNEAPSGRRSDGPSFVHLQTYWGVAGGGQGGRVPTPPLLGMSDGHSSGARNPW